VLTQANERGAQQVHATESEVHPRYLSYRGASRYTGLSRWTLARANERGELPAVRYGTTVRFAVEDLDEFMRSRRS
jgi:excisionase family DNA binding protein